MLNSREEKVDIYEKTSSRVETSVQTKLCFNFCAALRLLFAKNCKAQNRMLQWNRQISAGGETRKE